MPEARPAVPPSRDPLSNPERRSLEPGAAERDSKAGPRPGWIVAGVLAAALLGVMLFGAAVWLLARSAPPKPGANAQAQAQAPVKLPTQPAEWRGRIDYRALDARLADMTTDPSMQGLAVAVVEDGRLSFVHGYGTTAAVNGQPVDAQTVFRWASLSKTVSGTLSARLAADGLFALSDPLGAFQTSLRLPGDAQNGLTIEQLLSQRTGLPKNAYDDRLEAGEDPAVIRGSMAMVPPACAPGTCHSYQNIAYDTITEIIGARTGQSYDQTVRQRLFGPLGMASATIGEAGLVDAKSWARPHRHGRALTLSPAYYRVPSAAGVNSTIGDLAIWMQAQMGQRPDVLPAAVLDEVQRQRVGTAAPYGRLPIARELKHAGYGLGMRSFTYKGHRLVGHSGGVSGYRSTMMFDPATRTGIVMLWNSDANLPFRFQAEFFDRAYGLPFTDWLDLDKASPRSDPIPEG
jgi:beta-lactamase class C